MGEQERAIGRAQGLQAGVGQKPGAGLAIAWPRAVNSTCSSD